MKPEDLLYLDTHEWAHVTEEGGAKIAVDQARFEFGRGDPAVDPTTHATAMPVETPLRATQAAISSVMLRT